LNFSSLKARGVSRFSETLKMSIFDEARKRELSKPGPGLYELLEKSKIK
jgi:hypothetical protein